ncbi:MAG: LicD family protein [Lachnospiraceae bacterium]|nr:LicD family protein [Lachnospiraceae bacterium]
MQFPNSFFEDEVRDGFYVPGLMKRAWAAQLEVLEDIAKVCEKYDLHYHADWGTLIGAIRHGGFIPWDDDMDISMPRKDYDMFVKVALDELPEGYGILNFEHSDDGDFKCDDYLIRVYNSNRIRLDKPFLDKFHGFPYVAGMDIFPMDFIPPDEEEDKMLCEQISVLSTVGLGIGIMKPEEQEEYLQQIEKTYDVKFDRTKPLKRQVYMLSEQILRTYTGEGSEYITNIASRTRWDYKIPRKYYEETLMVPFETGQIAVPASYDAALRCKYKCYMELLRGGGGHEYPFYKRQERELDTKGRQILGKYAFSEKELERAEAADKGSLKTYTQGMLRLFRVIQKSVMDTIGQGNFSLAAELLESCQEGAIALGTKIEEIKGEGLAVIGILEQYCEILYNIHEMILVNDNVDADALNEMLEEILSKLEKKAQEDVLLRRSAVFLPFKASAWDSFESVWKAACADTACDVYVVPIPYYDKAIDGSLGKMHYDGDQYPDYVSITDYKTFDFGLHQPDMIFIHNPFDEYNFSASVHPFFYSRELQKFTENLIYIPYFVLDEFKDWDEYAAATMEHICTVPGVIHADKVILQSEQMRRCYIKALTDFAGDNTRPIWEKKILGLGSPKLDKELEEKADIKFPAKWENILLKPDGTKKIVILYHTNPDALLEHDEKLLFKIKNVLEVFKERREDIALIWQPVLQRETIIKTIRPKLWKRYHRLVEEYCSEGWGICDDAPESNQAIRISDGYYGDPSSIVRICKQSGMPSMIQNVEVLNRKATKSVSSGSEEVFGAVVPDQELEEKTVYETSEKSIEQLEKHIRAVKMSVQKPPEKMTGTIIYDILRNA